MPTENQKIFNKLSPEEQQAALKHLSEMGVKVAKQEVLIPSEIQKNLPNEAGSVSVAEQKPTEPQMLKATQTPVSENFSEAIKNATEDQKSLLAKWLNEMFSHSEASSVMDVVNEASWRNKNPNNN